MNILTFVFTTLLVIAILTYARLEMFLDFMGVKKEYIKMMTTDERVFFNEEQHLLYKQAPGDQKRGNQKSKQYPDSPKNSTSPGNPSQERLNSYLNIGSLINNHNAEVDPQRLTSLYNLLLRLLKNLYEDKPQFKEYYERVPDLNQQIVQLVIAKAQSNEQKKISNTKDLSNLVLGDDFLQEVYYKMLKGNHKNGFSEGYRSLLDYIIANNGKHTISIYLARPALLLAIFGDASVVKEVLEKRVQFFHALDNEKINLQDAENQMKTLFEHRALPDVDSQLLNFTISKTNPKDYQ